MGYVKSDQTVAGDGVGSARHFFIIPFSKKKKCEQQDHRFSKHRSLIMETHLFLRSFYGTSGFKGPSIKSGPNAIVSGGSNGKIRIGLIL